MRKNKYLSLFLVLGVLFIAGLTIRYSNLPPGDESQYVTSKYVNSPLNRGANKSSQSINKYGDRENSVLNEMRAFGIPLERSEIIPSYNNEMLNGAEDFNRALSLIKRAGENSALVKLNKMWKKKLNFNSVEIDLIAELLVDGDVEEVLDSAFRASEKDFINFAIDYKDGPGTLMPHLGQIRDIMKILSLKSMADKNSGKLEEAVKYINAALKLKSISNDNVTIIGELVENAASGILSENLQDLRGSGADLSDTYRLLEKDLSNSLDRQLNSLDGERVLLGDWVFDKMLNSPKELQSDELKSLFGQDLSNMTDEEINENYASYLKSMMEIRELMEEPYYVNSGKLEEKIKVASETALLKELVPSYSKIYKKYNEHQSLLKRNLLSLKVDEYKVRYGVMPKSLKMLDIPQNYLIDNVTGKFFIVNSDSNGNLSIILPVEEGGNIKL